MDPFKPHFKQMNAAIRPGARLVQTTADAMRRTRRRPPQTKRTARRGAASLAACAAVAACLLFLPGKSGPAAETPAPNSSSADTVPVPAATQPPAVGFTLRLHLSPGPDEQSPDLMESEQIRAGTTFRWGKQRITRSREPLTNPTTGEKYYGIHSEGFSPFLSIEGEDIVRVEAKAVYGSVGYMTESYDRHLQQEGLNHLEELFSFSVPFTDREAFGAYWDSDACAEWRQKAAELHPVMRAGETLCFQMDDAGENEMRVTVSVRWMMPRAPEIIDYARDGKILYLDWQIGGQLYDEFSRYPAVPYENITADTLCVTVTFADGRIQTQCIRLSFDKEGYVMAHLEE